MCGLEIEYSGQTIISIKPETLSIPHGWGHHRKGIKMDISKKHADVSINDLTDSTRIDILTVNANFSGTRIRIETKIA